MKHELQSYVSKAAPGFGVSVVREYLQARILQQIGLSGQMTSIAFMGGTALRFLYAIPRYSEDLDFALEGDRDRYRFDELLLNVARGFEREGYKVELNAKPSRTAVDKGFIKFPGLLHEMGLSPHGSEAISVKLEVDTNPPAGAVSEVTEIRRFVVTRLYHHNRSSLFSGKLAAVLMRQYTKGRDLYDLLWYLSDPTWPDPNMTLLRSAVAQSGWMGPDLDQGSWKSLVLERLGRVDWSKVRTEAIQFLERPQEAEMLVFDTFVRLLESRGL
ncbi:MAG: nucleotidyl transferase AbiEii/AbiGii toxin family protein [Coriobacteriia bacterium]|nr:nucleotidyl transferase AbiEii/AbiGii toxin family protein [Coriobacteriia bacterium]